MEIRDR